MSTNGSITLYLTLIVVMSLGSGNTGISSGNAILKIGLYVVWSSTFFNSSCFEVPNSFAKNDSSFFGAGAC